MSLDGFGSVLRSVTTSMSTSSRLNVGRLLVTIAFLTIAVAHGGGTVTVGGGRVAVGRALGSLVDRSRGAAVAIVAGLVDRA